MKQVLALNATKGFTDDDFGEMLDSRAPGFIHEVLNVHETGLDHLFSSVAGVAKSAGRLLSSGSDLNTAENGELNCGSETVLKMVNLFTYTLISVIKGDLNINRLKAVLICFSSQVFAIALAIVDKIATIDLEKITGIKAFMQSEFEAKRFWESEKAGEFPVARMAECRIGEIALANGDIEVFNHTQAVNAAVLGSFGHDGLEVVDATDDGIVQSFILGGVSAVQFHPELEIPDFRRGAKSLHEQSPMRRRILKLIEETPDFRRSTLVSHLM